jgi:hypothetical protein
MTQMNVEIIVSNRNAIAEDLPAEFQVMPWGAFSSNLKDEEGTIETHGDEETARLINAALAAYPAAGRIDFDHQSEQSNRATPPLILGHFTGYAARPGDGIYATGVTWTPVGEPYVKNKQLRYPSFAGSVRKSDGRVLKISSIALSPTLHIGRVKPVTNTKNGPEGQKGFDMKNIIEALGLKDGATEADCVAAINKQKAEVGNAAAAVKLATEVRNAAKVAADAKDDEVVLAVTNAVTSAAAAKNGTAAELVLVTNRLKDAESKLAELTTKVTNDQAAVRITNALSKGKITQADLDHAETGPDLRAKARDEGQWNSLMKLLPEKAPADGRVVNTQGNAGLPAGDRVTVINKAKSQYDSEKTLQQLTSKEAFVKDALQQAGLPRTLSDEEKRLVA